MAASAQPGPSVRGPQRAGPSAIARLYLTWRPLPSLRQAEQGGRDAHSLISNHDQGLHQCCTYHEHAGPYLHLNPLHVLRQ